MLKWNANFQIPNSGTQSAWVYIHAEVFDGYAELNFYSDETKLNHMFKKEIAYSPINGDVYDYILSLEEYNQYERVN